LSQRPSLFLASGFAQVPDSDRRVDRWDDDVWPICTGMSAIWCGSPFGGRLATIAAKRQLAVKGRVKADG
jgi:hypothetical protein